MRRSAEEAAVASAGAFSTTAAQQGLPFPTLTAMVVGGMVGAGVSLSHATLRKRRVSMKLSPGPSPAPASCCWRACSGRRQGANRISMPASAHVHGSCANLFSAFGYWVSAPGGNVSH